MTKKTTKIIVYELNELPWRVLDRYLSEAPNGPFARLVSESAAYTTITPDEGELSPWITWPTLHRGVDSSIHGLKFLNQDKSCSSQWPPIWEILQHNGITTGVFGSLQSFPPANSNMSLFHIPDTFSPSPITQPKYVSSFQAFNLKMTGKNKALAGGFGLQDAASLPGLLRSGVGLGSLGAVTNQLLRERIDVRHKKKRSVFQALISFDVYIKLLRKYQPRFSTFFTNHLAGAMHRYWRYYFPEDFDTDNISDDDYFNRGIVNFAMQIAERHISTLTHTADTDGYQLILTSSMGQEAIVRDPYEPEFIIEDPIRFLKAINADPSVKINLAMQPDISFEFPSQSAIEPFLRQLNMVSDARGKLLFNTSSPPVADTLNVKVNRSSALYHSKDVFLGGHPVNEAEAGLKSFVRDPGTGYHQPRGVLLWRGKVDSKSCRREIDSRGFAPTVLHNFGIPIPNYMQADVF